MQKELEQLQKELKDYKIRCQVWADSALARDKYVHELERRLDAQLRAWQVSEQKFVTERESELTQALQESVKYQSHYAELLNAYDGGHRMLFESAKAWMKRLRDLKP